MGTYGQDWASYQSATPDTSGLSFAFVKITEGTGYVNSEWRSQRDHAKANGLVWGGYHYPHMGNSVQAEADYFLAQVAWQPGDMVCLDWEGYDAANSGVSKARQAAYKDAFLRYVKSKLPHNPVGMYANVDYWRNVDTTGYYGDFLWIATAGLPAGQPGISAPWLFHQYSAATVDHDYCHLPSTQTLRDWALSFSSTPLEPDMPLSPTEIDNVASASAAKLKPELDLILLAVRQGAQTAQASRLAAENAVAQLTAVQALLANAASPVAAEVQAGMDAALQHLGTILATSK